MRIESLNQEGWLLKKTMGTIYLQSKLLLENHFNHAFFTSKAGENNPEFLNKLLGNTSSIHLLNQIHGNKVINASESHSLSIQKGDSLISDTKNQGLWVYTADCIPILLGDRKTGNVAAIHSGWKGLAKNNIKSTIIELEKNGSKRKNLIAALGPAISRVRYIVGQEVVNSIYKTLAQKNYSDNQHVTSWMSQLGCLEVKENQELMMDLRQIAKVNLIIEGFNESQISINSSCTFSEYKFFNSWRRDKGKGRQWSFIETKLNNKERYNH